MIIEKQWTMFFIFFLVLTSASDSIVDPSCHQELGEDGWRCLHSGVCITTNWLCDGFVQCEEMDESDEGKGEGEGCNLFPESQCLSFEGKRHYKCEIPGMPILCLPNREEAEQCKSSTGPPNRECKGGKWRCNDGRCIQGSQICNGNSDCDDESDESNEPFNGCNLFNSTCPSWGGEFMERCPGMESVCTVPQLASLGNASVCRDCLDDNGHSIKDQWRCNNGKCINSTLRGNGIFDCDDGSDEISPGINNKWTAMLLTAIFITLIGLGLSFFCRYINVWNPKTCFNCDLCSSSRKKHMSSEAKWWAKYAALPMIPQGSYDATDKMVVTPTHEQDRENEDDPFYKDSDIPIDLIKYFDDRAKYWTHKRKDEQENHPVILSRLKGLTLDRPHISSPIMIRKENLAEARTLYTLLHNDPVRYHHLYMYLANRASTVRQLAKVTNILLDWERDLHNLQNLEVRKCWRLHLGSSKLTAMVINSVSDTPTFCSRLDNICYPVRNFFRKIRRMCLQVKINQDYWLTRVIKTFYFLISPFVQASLFYLEMIKQMTVVYILWIVLNSLSNNSPTNHPFELGMVVSMIISILVVQILFAVYSFIFCNDIFEIGHKAGCKSNVTYFFKCIAATMGFVGIMPAYVLANHVHYKVKQDMRIRHLQTHQFDDDEDDDNPGTFVKMEQNRDEKLKERINIYKEVCKFESKANLYGKLYNYYRVTSAVLGSVTFLVVLVLLMFVTGRDNREIQLLNGVDLQLKALLNSIVSTDIAASHLAEELNVVQDIVFVTSLITSLLAVVTAISNYWYLAKNLALSWAGFLIISCYLTCMVVNRLTTYISIFAITQPVKHDNESSDPTITLVPGIFIFCILCIIQIITVFLYKRRYSKAWNTGTKVDQWINVLINSLVVIPFMAQKDHIKILKQKERRFSFSPETKCNSLTKKTSTERSVSEVELQSRGMEIANMGDSDPASCRVLIPDVSQLALPFAYDDLCSIIRQIWWENPTRRLEMAEVRKHLEESKEKGLKLMSLDKNLDKMIKKTLVQLEFAGLINLPLLNPVPTRREYFWLFVMVVSQNLVALIIELINGGLWTSDGHYYSWDVRLVTLLLGLVFLIMYYKKYHVLRDLTTDRVCGDCHHHLFSCLRCINAKQRSTPTNKERTEIIMPDENTPVHREMQTQTSFLGQHHPSTPFKDSNDVPSAPTTDGNLQKVVVQTS